MPRATSVRRTAEAVGISQDELGPRLRNAVPGRLGGCFVVALIPAHNEEAGITETVLSLRAQTSPPDAIVVMADNCSDETVARAKAAGAWVCPTVGNTAKKAGALNQGLTAILPALAPGDFVLCQDADGQLEPHFLVEALRTFTMVDGLGGLSGAVVARSATNRLETAQAIEYARGMRLMSRAGGRVHVLSGAATLFPVHALLAIAQHRGDDLPGTHGEVFLEDSLTEDYELTLAMKKLGFACRSTKRCRVVTDLMPTLRDLKVQRIRWFRGALESMWLYGFNRRTAKTWCGIAWTFLVSLMFPATVAVLVTSWFLWGMMPDFRYALLFPVFAAEGVVTARRIDRRARVMATLFIPLWCYDNFMFALYWTALWQASRKGARVWIT